MIRNTMLCLLLAAQLANAGEVKLREFHTAQSSVVRLADVADFLDLSDAEREEIAPLPLFPAPSVGLHRQVTAQDVREIMSLYGLSLPTLRVSGSCRVEGSLASKRPANESSRISFPSDVANAAGTTATKSTEPQAEQENVLHTDLLAYLATKDRLPTEWSVSFQLSPAQAKSIAAMQRPELSGGLSPWVGKQTFQLRDRGIPNSTPVTFQAEVQRIARAVIARRSLEAGAILGENDVELGEINPNALSTSVMLNLNDVVGKQLKRPLASGQILLQGSVQKPVLVKRGELVTVYSLAAGVQVKAVAKAMAEGGLGDVVQLESTESKKHFQARITAPQEAMVFIDTPTVAVEQAARVPTAELKRN